MKTSRSLAVASLRICFYFIALLMLSAKGEPQSLELSNRLSVNGSAIALFVTQDSTIKTIIYFEDDRLLAITDSISPIILQTSRSGFHKWYAKIEKKDGSISFSDTQDVFTASQDELSRFLSESSQYTDMTKTFPDSLIELPQGALILGYTHSTTKKTTIKYLNRIPR